MSYTLLASLLAFAFFWSPTYGEITKLLARQNACFSAKEFSTGYTFSAPANGDIFGIELHYRSGGVTCYSPLGLIHWGCEGNDNPVDGFFMVQLIREETNNDHQSIYPTSTTDGITYFWDDTKPCTQCDISRYGMS